MQSRSLFFALTASVLSAVSAFGQDSQPTSPVGQELPYRYVSRPLGNATKDFVRVAETVVEVKGAAWIRVFFSQLDLDGASFVRVISARDGDMQEFDAGMAAAWGKSTAYFNGEAIVLELWAAPGSTGNQMAIERIAAEMSLAPVGVQGQCGIIGATDDRTISSVDFACRVMPVGCTATIYCRSSAMVTAGHCLGAATVVQFRVPNSLANCDTVNPPAAEQFPVTATMGTNGGPGNDFGVMTIGTNTLGQTPYHRYNILRNLGSTPANGNPISFNGYGLDTTCVRSQTQQLSSGNVTTVSGSSYEFTADLRGGNSGSSVLNANSTIVGIVTHCLNNNSANIAQRMDLAGFVNARNNLAGICNSTLRLIDVQASGATGPAITVSAADVNGLTSGSTNFKRVYVNGASVSFTAPATASGACFVRWVLDGAGTAANPVVVSMTADHTLLAEYGACGQPNDQCASAIDVSAGGTFNGSVVGASNDGTATCGNSATSPDVWYSFTAPNAPTRLFVDTCGSNDAGAVDTGVDTVVSVLASCGGTELACNDDRTAASGPSCGSLDTGAIRDSSLFTTLPAGQTVRIRVASFGTTPPGPFTMHVRFEPVNDACATATDVSGGGIFLGTLVNATTDGTATCGSSGTNPDVWYTFTAGGAGNLTVDTCGSNDANFVDTVVSLLTACGGTELTCNDDRLVTSGPSCGALDTGAIRDSSILWPLAAGQSVAIRVSKFGASALLPFTLRVNFTGPACDPDFNCDGNTDQDDVSCLIAVVAGNPGCQCADPDFNVDGNVDQDDVAALINVIAGGSCP